jgi:hypothetical protein
MGNENVYIALCDILGFKDLIMNNSFEHSSKIIQNFIKIIDYSAKLRQRYTNEVNTVVNYNLFSDTIALWSNDDLLNSFVHLMRVTKTLFNLSMELGLPLRGAISSGNLNNYTYQYESDKSNIINAIFGTSLIKAYYLERDQKWSGCVIDPELEKQENELRMYLQAKWMGKFFVRYNVPIEKKRIINLLTINWVDLDEDKFNIDIIRKSFSAHNKPVEKEEVKEKIENTIIYYQYVKNIKKFT